MQRLGNTFTLSWAGLSTTLGSA